MRGEVSIAARGVAGIGRWLGCAGADRARLETEVHGDPGGQDSAGRWHDREVHQDQIADEIPEVQRFTTNWISEHA